MPVRGFFASITKPAFVPGCVAAGLAVGSMAQASRGHQLDELWFSLWAVGLGIGAFTALRRAAPLVDRSALATGLGVAPARGLDVDSPLWAVCVVGAPA